MVQWAGIYGCTVWAFFSVFVTGFLVLQISVKVKTSIPAFLEHHLVLWCGSGRGSGIFFSSGKHMGCLSLTFLPLSVSPFPFSLHSFPKKEKRIASLCNAVTSRSCKAVEMVLSHIKEYLDISKPFYNSTENLKLLLCYSCFRGRHLSVQTVLQRPQSYSGLVDTLSAGS